ncbi:MAG: 30S ribosomal protein S5 [bacterium]|nr:30S ribosomal protein S5 [bacterium]
MNDTQEKTEEKTEAAVPVVVAGAPVPVAPEKAPARFGRDNRGGRGPRRSNRRDTRTKPEFDQKIISLRRVTRVVAGGRRFSFSVGVVAGNRKGMVGVGMGKAGDTPLAIEKAFRDAKKNMITVNTTKDMSIPHEVESKFASSKVRIMPAPGKGILAGSSVRTVLDLAGIKEVSAKLQTRSKNSLNNASAAIEALRKLEKTRIRNK